jgi:hypothetical protein
VAKVLALNERSGNVACYSRVLRTAIGRELWQYAQFLAFMKQYVSKDGCVFVGKMMGGMQGSARSGSANDIIFAKLKCSKNAG